jgi:hypothetical protein
MLPPNYVLPIMTGQGVKHSLGYGMIVDTGSEREKATRVVVQFESGARVLCAVENLQPARMPADELHRLQVKWGLIEVEEEETDETQL